MYLYNEFIINIVNDINSLLCLSKSNSKWIELTVHTSCYWGLRLTLCYIMFLSINLIYHNFDLLFFQCLVMCCTKLANQFISGIQQDWLRQVVLTLQVDLGDDDFIKSVLQVSLKCSLLGMLQKINQLSWFNVSRLI